MATFSQSGASIMDSEPQMRTIKFTPNFSVEIRDKVKENPYDGGPGPFEAEILNQTRADLIKKHFLKYVKAKDTLGELGALGIVALDYTITEFSKTYEFGDQSKKVSIQARKLAKAHVTEGIRSAGYVLSQVSKENMIQLVDKALADNDRYQEKAQELVPVGEQLALLEYTGESTND